MKSHGMLFSAPMVRALLRGIKTQTRRLITPHNSLLDGSPVTKANRWIWDSLDWSQAYVDAGPSPAGNEGQYWHVPERKQFKGADVLWHRIYPRIRPGDELWVKETHALLREAPEPIYAYRADFAGEQIFNWSPSILMPRVASRLTLGTASVRTERLNDISAEDALAEGIDHYTPGVTAGLRGEAEANPIEEYRELWERINGSGSWAANPPVWIYDLTRKTSAA